MMRKVYCYCLGERVEASRCDGCGPDDSWLYDDRYEDPPLYPAGYLAGLSPEQLEREADRQAGIQGSAGDNLDRPGIEMVIENAEARWRLVENEIKRRKEAVAETRRAESAGSPPRDGFSDPAPSSVEER